MSRKSKNDIFGDATSKGLAVDVSKDVEMSCGACGFVPHAVGTMEVKSKPKPGPDDACHFAACYSCGLIRPLNKNANELLHELRMIPDNEYLSWAVN